MNRFNFAISAVFIAVFNLVSYSQAGVSITWEVTKYDITATLPQNYSTNRDLSVRAIIGLKNVSAKAYSRLTLRISDKATVSSVQVNGSNADFRKGEQSIGGERRLQQVIIGVGPIQPNSALQVTVVYKLKVSTNSGLNALSPVGSQFLPLSHWYPTPNSWYFPKGSDFAPYRLMVNSSSGETVISSGVESANSLGLGSAASFEQKLNGQPHFIVGRWNKEVNTANGISVYTPEGVESAERASELSKFALEARSFVEATLGEKVEAPIRIVAVNRGAGFSDGGTIFIDDSVFMRQKLDSQTAMTIAEAIAKIYFGNLVEVNGDGYGVIREGFSRYIATQFIEKKFGKRAADIERLRQRSNYSNIAARHAPLAVISPLDGYYYSAMANKGAMICRYLSKNLGEKFFASIKERAVDGTLDIAELRNAFATEKVYLDYMLDKNTDMNLMIGLPQATGGQTKVALRNDSEIIASVDVVGTTSTGQKMSTKVNIPANGFGEAVFNTGSNRIVRAEIDVEKLYPQTNYSDDFAPRLISGNNPILFIKREFDRQRFSDAEKNALAVLRIYPDLEGAKILLARSLLAQSKMPEAQRIFRSVLDEKLPTARSLAWSNFGLGQIASKAGQSSAAKQFFDKAINADAEYGATLGARIERNKVSASNSVDPSVRAFFGNFDRSVSANRKSEIDAMIIVGEVSRFASRVAGQAQGWKTDILWVDRIDANNILVEANMTVRLSNREDESGLAVFRLSKVGNAWKLSGVEIFEVR